MNAPDKIYVSRNFSEDNSPHGLWYLNKSEHDINVEYLRKDALMEWAKEQQRIWEECINTSKKFPELKKSWATYSGAKVQTEELIDKLNSM